ncbi:MAG: hypothetical protein CFE24_15180 [Flavobacterium sp. BFFFF2]|nr:MAG: hypothetical protein CFE24_15180 [Flavobacterium sp. BFFFF2]
MNYNEKLKEILWKIESDYQIKFEETHLPDPSCGIYMMDELHDTFISILKETNSNIYFKNTCY